MRVLNIHERVMPVSAERIGALIDSLASPQDALWPTHAWPRMELDRPLGVDASGGHGPVRYLVEAHSPGRSVTFRFTGPRGFDGVHCYECVRTGDGSAQLRHTLAMEAHGLAILSWPFAYRPLHDALLEDSLATAQTSLGLEPQVEPWSLWVRWLRWLLTRGKARPQTMVGRSNDRRQRQPNSDSAPTR